MKHFIDLPYHTFTPWNSELTVVCPKCGKKALVRASREEHRAYISCDACGYEAETFAGLILWRVTDRCWRCRREFSVYLKEGKPSGMKVPVKCPYCKNPQIGDAVEEKLPGAYSDEAVRLGFDPFFHCPFYYLTTFRNRVIWAFNKAHLQYLIEYLSAESQGEKGGYEAVYKIGRTQSDSLPRFMKSERNRERVVALLQKLQEK